MVHSQELIFGHLGNFRERDFTYLEDIQRFYEIMILATRVGIFLFMGFLHLKNRVQDDTFKLKYPGVSEKYGSENRFTKVPSYPDKCVFVTYRLFISQYIIPEKLFNYIYSLKSYSDMSSLLNGILIRTTSFKIIVLPTPEFLEDFVFVRE